MNVSLLGDFCKDEVPRLCDHTLLSNSSRFTRPCSPSESYVSTGSELTLEQTLKQGSVLFPLDFMVRYEFVNTMLEGAHVQGSDNPCDRVFTSSMTAPSSGRIQSPRSVFYYGRGGAHNLSCIMRFEPTLGERVQVRIYDKLLYHQTERAYKFENVPWHIKQVWLDDVIRFGFPLIKKYHLVRGKPMGSITVCKPFDVIRSDCPLVNPA